jgi:peroxiredoxin
MIVMMFTGSERKLRARSMNGKLIYLICAMLSIAGVTHAQKEFKLTAYVKGYEGKTKVIINKILPTHDADMVSEQVLYMTDGRFEFDGRVEEPTKYSIRIRPENIPENDPVRGESASIFVENNAMTLTGEKGNFKYSHVTGSSIQDQHEEQLHYVRQKTNGDMSFSNEYTLEFSLAHPEYLSSVHSVSFFTNRLPVMVPGRVAAEFYGKLNDVLRKSYHGQQIKQYIDNVTLSSPLTKQDKLHKFSLPDSLGNPVSVDALAGKILLIDFWFAGCGPCRLENKNFQAIYEQYRDKGFEILSVSSDRNRSEWLKAMQTDKIVWKSVWDKDSKVTTHVYRVKEFPTTYLVDANGRIIARNLRGEGLRIKLEELLGTRQR